MSEPAKPTVDFTWATANVNNGPNGEANKVIPSSAKQTNGWNYLEKPAREFFNYWMNAVYQWLGWAESSIDDLYAQNTALIGFMFDFAGTSAPANYLICDGTAISRTTYSALFAVIGTTWGSGDGTTTFNLPDFQGRTSIGSGAGVGLTARTTGQNGGEETHTLTKAETPPHVHQYNSSTSTFSGTGGGGFVGANQGTGVFNTGDGSADGLNGDAHNNMQPFAVATKIIRYQ